MELLSPEMLIINENGQTNAIEKSEKKVKKRVLGSQ